MVLYHVSHVHPDPQYDDVEEWYHIGVYSGRHLAERAVTELRTQPGFSRFPDGFSIEETHLDQTNWEGGFEGCQQH